MTRVGCVCINAAKEEIREIAMRFPEEIERIAEWEAVVSMASKKGESSFYPNPDREAHLDKRGIYKMVAWSKTSRGGRQMDFIKANNTDEAASACASAYGLCD